MHNKHARTRVMERTVSRTAHRTRPSPKQQSQQLCLCTVHAPVQRRASPPGSHAQGGMPRGRAPPPQPPRSPSPKAPHSRPRHSPARTPSPQPHTHAFATVSLTTLLAPARTTLLVPAPRAAPRSVLAAPRAPRSSHPRAPRSSRPRAPRSSRPRAPRSLLAPARTTLLAPARTTLLAPVRTTLAPRGMRRPPPRAHTGKARGDAPRTARATVTQERRARGCACRA